MIPGTTCFASVKISDNFQIPPVLCQLKYPNDFRHYLFCVSLHNYLHDLRYYLFVSDNPDNCFVSVKISK
jgi:hypothetical protein